jgi:hypothetical protein
MGHFILTEPAAEDLREIIAYAYKPDTKPLEIVRIVHGAQNLGRFFRA